MKERKRYKVKTMNDGKIKLPYKIIKSILVGKWNLVWSSKKLSKTQIESKTIFTLSVLPTILWILEIHHRWCRIPMWKHVYLERCMLIKTLPLSNQRRKYRRNQIKLKRVKLMPRDLVVVQCSYSIYFYIVWKFYIFI